MLISHIYLSGICVNFLVIVGVNWEYFFFIGLVKFMEIGNFEDFMLF